MFTKPAQSSSSIVSNVYLWAWASRAVHASKLSTQTRCQRRNTRNPKCWRKSHTHYPAFYITPMILTWVARTPIGPGSRIARAIHLLNWPYIFTKQRRKRLIGRGTVTICSKQRMFHKSTHNMCVCDREHKWCFCLHLKQSH